MIVAIGKTNWKSSSGFNVYVDLTTACNSSCPFCIAPTVGRMDGPGFFSGLEFAAKLVESIGGSFQIVGGEPSISRRLSRALQICGSVKPHRFAVNTSGSMVTPEMLVEMERNGVTHFNISRHHYDDMRNQEIMGTRPLLPNETLRHLVSLAQEIGLRVRMQCNLLKGYIDNSDSMLEFASWAASMKVSDVSFSQTFPLSLFDYQIPLESGYTERMAVDLREIVADLDRDFTVFSHGDCTSSWGSSAWATSTWGGWEEEILEAFRFHVNIREDLSRL